MRPSLPWLLDYSTEPLRPEEELHPRNLLEAPGEMRFRIPEFPGKDAQSQRFVIFAFDAGIDFITLTAGPDCGMIFPTK